MPSWHSFEPELTIRSKKQNATLQERTRYEKKEEKWRDRGKNKEKCNRLGEGRKPEQTNNEKQKKKKKRETLQDCK